MFYSRSGSPPRRRARRRGDLPASRPVSTRFLLTFLAAFLVALPLGSLLSACVPAVQNPATKSSSATTFQWPSGWSVDVKVSEGRCPRNSDGRARVAGENPTYVKYDFILFPPKPAPTGWSIKRADWRIEVVRFLPKNAPEVRNQADASHDQYRVRVLEAPVLQPRYCKAGSTLDVEGAAVLVGTRLINFVRGTRDLPFLKLPAVAPEPGANLGVQVIGGDDVGSIDDLSNVTVALGSLLKLRPSSQAALARSVRAFNTQMWIEADRIRNHPNQINGWSYLPISGMRCQSSDEVGVMYNLADEEVFDGTLLIYLSGGGACFDAATCEGWKLDLYGGQYQRFSPLDGAEAAADPNLLAGQNSIFARTDENPFENSHMIYVPYCTGDIHMGNNPDAGYVHNGYNNLTKVLSHVVPTAFGVEAKRVVLAGDSAGGLGAMLNYPRAIEFFDRGKRFGIEDNALPRLPVHLINDGGSQVVSEVNGDPVFSECLQRAFYERWRLDRTLPDKFFDQYSGDEFDPISTSAGLMPNLTHFPRFVAENYRFSVVNGREIEQRQAYISAARDKIMRVFLGEGLEGCKEQEGMDDRWREEVDYRNQDGDGKVELLLGILRTLDGATYEDALLESRARLPTDSHFKYFLVEDDDHHTYVPDKFFNTKNGDGDYLHRWLGHLHGSPFWDHSGMVN